MFYGVQINIKPDDLDEIETIIRERDIIRTVYPSSVFNPYSLGDYLDQIHVHKAIFHAMLDRNILSEIISVINNYSEKALSETQRTACALLAYFQISDTLIEPGMAIWELVDSGSHEQARGELALFRAADNLHPQQFIDIALGRINTVKIHVDQITDEPLEKKVGEDFSTWKVHYGLMLKLAILESTGGKWAGKFEAFIDWLYTDYIFSGPAVVFAIICFSQKRFKRMFKKLTCKSRDELLRGIRNVAWDMTIVHYWGQKVMSDRQKGILWLFCTEDKVLKEIANYIVRSYDDRKELETFTKKKFIDYLGLKYGKDLYNKYKSYIDNIEDESRKINKCKSQEKIVMITDELEEELLRLKGID